MADDDKKTNLKSIDDVDFQIIWQDKPAGLLQRFLTTIGLNFTTYQITKDEMIIIRGFLKKRMNSCELYMLKDPDLTENIYQRLLGIATVRVVVDTHGSSNRAGQFLYLKNIRNAEKVRKLLRDAIEADVMERKITYFDKL